MAFFAVRQIYKKDHFHKNKLNTKIYVQNSGFQAKEN